MASVKLEGLSKKLAELNASVSPESQLDAESIGKLKDGLTAASANTAAPFSDEMYYSVAPVCAKLLSWPAGDARVPGMDAVRVLLSNDDFRAAGFKQAGTPLSLPELQAFMLEAAGLSGDGSNSVESVPCQMLALRTLANAFGGTVGLQDHVAELMPLLERFNATKLSKHSQIALSTVLLNCAVAVVQKGETAVAELGGELLRVVGRRLDLHQRVPTADPEATYRILVAIGTLISSSDIMVAVAMSLPEVSSTVAEAAASSNLKVKHVARDVRKVMGL
jgi:phospholipase A-2-activating protein